MPKGSASRGFQIRASEEYGAAMRVGVATRHLDVDRDLNRAKKPGRGLTGDDRRKHVYAVGSKLACPTMEKTAICGNCAASVEGKVDVEQHVLWPMDRYWSAEAPFSAHGSSSSPGGSLGAIRYYKQLTWKEPNTQSDIRTCGTIGMASGGTNRW